MAVQYNYQIASTWNNEVGFTNVESLDPTGTMGYADARVIPGTPSYFTVTAYDTYARGQRRYSPDGTASFAGFKRVVWLMSDVDALAYNWFIAQYEGLVTIATTLGYAGTYTNYNAYCRCPDPSELQTNEYGRYANIEVEMILVETT